ncbi:dTDP-4-dehydrorhamnose 3,5-epimerase family protein [Streptomyces sp. IBSBF 2953]|uniref:dTDP-4-dehydrorhamnose 3,5-epimerase family protein n=1 Tax=Streptomyces TaxID=1883 RepID=UPI00211A534D|nr:dTDP-4-dehydrorhamnose 3,5-epimerase family protein [Streptomyces scabiei]MCQ9184198.1 dTDP-4-dehydrorhamnose 3,5-epimerase family protein [Streptomyces hayashii]MDX3117944.1 dTDP-4-dehydrorhamnose 3,5-epimerase family protein [Streptomyces scabiei]
MRFDELSVPGAYVITPDIHPDPRGDFFESLRVDLLEDVLGHAFRPLQVNCSTSRRNTLRGIHSVTSPPGQAKYVTCVRGSVRDIVVDLRPGSPAFGSHAVNVLDAASGRAVYVPEGVGHGFLTLADDSCVCYVLDSVYVPGTQIDVDPLDPDLALPWGFDLPPVLSEKDASAQSLKEALDSGILSG